MKRPTRKLMSRRNILLAAGTATAAIVAVAACGQMPEEAPEEKAEPAATSQAEAAQPTPSPDLPPNVQFSTFGWKTDFSKHSVPLDEISSGGPGKDGIPSIDFPQFNSVDKAFYADTEPVVVVEVNGEAKAYPIEILIWHEIVNDTLGGVPVTVTFCPLCNTAIAFDRRLDGIVYDFGVSGNLRYSDLIMYDRQTESWWQQITGTAIVGELTGKKLTSIPASIVSFADFQSTYPKGLVLSSETGYMRPYGSNPYPGYDNISRSPFLFFEPVDGRLPAMERVVTVSLNGEDAAYPFNVLAEQKVVEDSVGGEPIVVFHQPGVDSPFSATDIGAAGVFAPTLDGTTLKFKVNDDGTIVDTETQSQWNVLGRAIAGPLEGKQLQSIVNGNHFWFAWAVFKPETRVFGLSE
ncbi:MAG: DUF3179 domain-containing protein [Chloroflexota bacterium]|nr:DUF3179 domain-containing protein [Chloroflexota bacterium]MDE2931555.1 DUF3179 domain-containing protein [Chloroflexota bacterium]